MADGTDELEATVARLEAERDALASKWDRARLHQLAVAADHAGPIDLLLTDVAMPEMGGIELAAALCETRPGLKVLFTSGHTEHADLLSRPLGAGTHFLPKPFLPGDLTHAVVAILEGQSPAGDPPRPATLDDAAR